MDALERIENGELMAAVWPMGKEFTTEESMKLRDEVLYLAKLGKRYQLVSVKKRMPHEGQQVDIFTEQWGREIDHTFRNGEFIVGDDDAYVVTKNVTHWREIPPNPGEGE